MRTVRVLIKAFALCLAGVIIVTIVACMLGAVSLVGTIAGLDENTPGEMNTIWENDNAIAWPENLDISIGATTLRIYESQDEKKVRIETNNEHITSWQEGDTLQVVEKSHLYLSNLFSDGDLAIYLPKGIKFDTVKIDAGAGTLKIEKMVANELSLKLGAGKTTIDSLEVKGEAKIDGGAGYMEVKEGRLNNLDLELGAGKTELTLELTGKNEIHSAVGKLDLNLIGKKSDYKVMIDKGVGSVAINGGKQSDEAIYGEGKNLVKIDSGVGAVEIRMTEN